MFSDAAVVVREPAPRVSGAAAPAFPFVPGLRLRAETLHRAAGPGPGEGPARTAVAELWFDYGGRRVPADPRRASGCGPVRDLVAETRARQILESFGAVEPDMLDSCDLPLGVHADYLLVPDGDDTALSAFSAYALPQLRALGFSIELAPAYPWRAIADDLPWFADVSPDPQRVEWFTLMLGVEIEGRRVDLLPALLDLMRQTVTGGDLETLLPRSGRAVAVRLPDGGQVLIPGERLRVLLSVMGNLYRGDNGGYTPSFPMIRAGALAGLDAAFARGTSPRGGAALLRWEGAREVRDRATSFEAGPAAASAAPPEGLQATLRGYQIEGLAWLQHLARHQTGGILADDMGLGKTLQTIAHVALEKQKGNLDRPALIIAPTSLVGNWAREFAKFVPSLKVLAYHGSRRRELRYRVSRSDVVLTSYPVLIRDLAFLEKVPFHLLILDEAQAIKNPRSQAHEAVRSLNARLRLCLSGTPIENNLGELWSEMEFLMPGLLGSQESFRSHFQIPIERESNDDRMADLRTRVIPFVLRRTKEEVVPELPPKTEIVRPVELHGAQRDLYESIRLAAHDKVRHAIAEQGLAGASFAILDALMKLRQVCCDPRLVPLVAAREITASAKFDFLFELLAQQLPRGRRVLLFSQFTSMLGLIARGLQERGVRFVSLTGETRGRDQVVATFERGDAEVFLISLKAGGTGLNLVSADTVIHYDPWWNPAVQAQATDRAYRIGQKKPVFVYNLIAAGSVEERMLALQERKRALAGGILAGGRPGHSLSAADVDDLLAPLAPSDASDS